MCKKCAFRCSWHCLKEGGIMNDFKLLKVKMAAKCGKIRNNRPNIIFGLDHSQSFLNMQFA